jgi:hypothetical protein
MQRTTILSVDSTARYVSPESSEAQAIRAVKKFGRQSRVTIRCKKHGFRCDPLPGKDSQWLCPWCECPWAKRKPVTRRRIDHNMDPKEHGSEAPRTKPVITARARVLAELESANPPVDKRDLVARLLGILEPAQIQNALEGLANRGVKVPDAVFAPRKRCDGLPDHSRSK